MIERLMTNGELEESNKFVFFFFQAIFDVIINKLNHFIDILIDVMSLSIIILILLFNIII